MQPYVVQAAEIMVEAFKNDGLLIYAGAGTSGRLVCWIPRIGM